MICATAPGVARARSVSRKLSLSAAFLFTSSLFASYAHAVIARGVVTDALGQPIPGARVQLVRGGSVAAIGIAGADGSYEIQFGGAGRFVLLSSAVNFYPGVGQEFYGGASDIVTKNVVLEAASVYEQVTVSATGVPTPIQQVSAAVTLIPEQELTLRQSVVDVLRLSPGVAMVQTGQAGGVSSLFVRGGNSDAGMALIDGIPADDVGGRFDFGNVATAGLGPVSASGSGIEMYRGADSVLYGSDAEAGVVSLATARGTSVRPELDYSGDAGNLHSYRNEVSVGGTLSRLDYFAALSRFDTSNALPMDEYHIQTAAANFGYSLGSNTSARFTIRNSNSAVGLPGAFDFYGVASPGKQSDQDLYSGLTVEDRRESGWHNQVQYGIVRKREQAVTFYPAGEFLNDANGGDYYGNAVTIRGANGYTATGRAILAYTYGPVYPGEYPQGDDAVSNRDQFYYQTDYVFPHKIGALFGFRYENERGSFVYPTYGEDERIQRTNFEYTGELTEEIKNRVFLSAGGAVEKNHLYGIAGTPRFGVVYAAVRPENKWFHGTRIRGNVATGVQEPSLAVDFSSLYTQLAIAGNTAAISQYGIRPIRELRSRTLDVGVDQNIRGEKLVLHVGYYHNQYSHQIEFVDPGTLQQYFNLPICVYGQPQTNGCIPNVYGADVGSQAFRAQGVETEIDWRPTARWSVRGGWTYLDAVVEQSFSSDEIAIQGGYASENPNISGVPIGESPFVGARPFRRSPHTGFFDVDYSGPKLTWMLQGALASRSDDSTFLDYADLAGTDSMILPNRDLDYGYAKIDMGVAYALRHRVSVFSQVDNLLNDQHIGPIGYPGLPLTVRAGLKVRVGGD